MSIHLIKEELKNLSRHIYESQLVMLSGDGPLPGIELDILLQQYRRAYELLRELEKIQGVQSTPFEAPDNLIASAERSTITQQQTTSAETPETKITITTSEIPQSGQTVKEEPVSVFEDVNPSVPEWAETVPAAPLQPEVIIANVETPVEAAKNEVVTEATLPQAGIQKERAREYTKTVKTVATASLFDEAPTVAQQFHGAATVRDRYTTNDDSIAEKLQQNPLSDLKKSIGINEKFSFVNELFDGDLGSYNEAIENLNTCKNLDAAMDILHNTLAARHQWTTDGSSFVQLKNLVTRRFSA